MGLWKDRLLPRSFRFLGGEPALNPRLVELIEVARRNWPDSQLCMTTNGLVLHRQPRLAEALAANRVHITWTIHHESEEYQAAIAPVRETIEEWKTRYGIPVMIEHAYRRWSRRYQGHGRNVLPFEDHDEVSAWKNCACKFCRQLFRGRLWKCSTIAYLQLQKEKFPDLSPKWDPYLAYQGLDASCSDEELHRFFKRQVERICGMCPAKPERFDKPLPFRRSAATRVAAEDVSDETMASVEAPSL